MLSIKVSVWLILILTCGKVFSQEAEFKLCKDSGGLLITESLCKPVDYDKSRPPRKKMFIEADVALHEMRDLDEKHHTMTTLLFMQLIWNDPRLIMANLSMEGHQSSQSRNLANLWVPDLFVYNIIEYDQVEIRDNNGAAFFFVRNDSVSVILAIKVFITTSCELRFHKFPFDTQSCPLGIGSNHPTNQIEYVNFKMQQDPQHNFMKEFTMTMKDRNYNYSWEPDAVPTPTNGEMDIYSVVGFELTLSRNRWPYIWSYFVPVTGLVLVGSISFWIPTEVIPGRVGLLVTLSLVLISVFNIVQSKIPKSDKMTALGIYVIASLIFIFAALFEYAFILFKKRRKAMMKAKISLKTVSGEEKKTGKAWPPDLVDLKLLEAENIYEEAILDQVAFFLYIIAFALFHLVYWFIHW